MQNALATIPPPIDSWDAAADDLGPVRGTNVSFDAGAYFAGIGKAKTPIESGRMFVATELAEGWLFLKKDCPPEWVMRNPGEPMPEQPFVAEDEWPSDLSGNPAHPWKWTRLVYLLDKATGETLTFSSSTNGGRIAIRDLTSQIREMRNLQPGAVPIISLQSQMMSTQFGQKPRPFFKIEGWKIRGGDAPKQLTSDDGGKEVNAYDDDSIPF
jgi:hypothetical protein